MRTYDVWYKKDQQDGRAPEFAFLDVDYKWAGELAAVSLRDLAMKVRETPDDGPDLDGQRAFQVGDVVQEDCGQYWILTPEGIWASVNAFLGSLDT